MDPTVIGMIAAVPAGVLAGSLINWAADSLPRFASQPPRPRPTARLEIGLWRLVRTSLSERRPEAAMEIAAALLYAFIWVRSGLSWRLLLLIVAGTFFLLVAAIDLKHRLVLDVLVYPAGIIALLLHLLLPEGRFLAALVGGAFGFFTFLFTALLRPKGLGGGDVKLAAVIGLATGFPEVLWALALGIVSGGIAALILVLVAHREAQSTMPYAPFLCLGAIVALLYNPLPLFFPS